jgi:hypothetical protein
MTIDRTMILQTVADYMEKNQALMIHNPSEMIKRIRYDIMFETTGKIEPVVSTKIQAEDDKVNTNLMQNTLPSTLEEMAEGRAK